jgi:membrane-bound metal-dependent hydrolase YbcI (DUF457 family)
MYLIGHFALGYFSSLIVSKFTGEEVNIPLICFVSMLPDIDIFIPFLTHRGPTHSIILATLLSLPILLRYRRGYPYYAALASHSLIGDYFTAYGCQLLWPLTTDWFKAGLPLLVNGGTMITLEASLFAIMLITILLKSGRRHIPPSFKLG